MRVPPSREPSAASRSKHPIPRRSQRPAARVSPATGPSRTQRPERPFLRSPAAAVRRSFVRAIGADSTHGRTHLPTTHARLLRKAGYSCSQTFRLGFSKLSQPLHHLQLDRKGIETQAIPPRTQCLKASAPPRRKLEILYGRPA